MKVCEAVDALLSAHLLGALDGSEEALVGDHLVSCPTCRAARQDTARCLEQVSAPPEAPPPLVWSSIRARIERSGGDDPVRAGDAEAVIHLACSFCRGGLVRRNAVYCASCLAPHHSDCFDEYGRCSVMGCGEQRVVLPRALPQREPEPAPPPRQARWPWLLVTLASGGVLATAAWGPMNPEGRGPIAPLARAPHHRSGPGLALFHVEVQAATLGELARELAMETGRPLEVPLDAKHHLLVRESWRGRSWEEIAREAGGRFGLVFEEARGSQPARYVPSQSFSPGPLKPPGSVSTKQIVLQGRSGRSDPIWEGSDPQLVVAPQGRGLAVLDGGVYLYLGDRQVASADGRPLAGAWSADGRGFAALLGERERTRLVLFSLVGESAEQRELAAFGPALDTTPGSLAWLEDGLLVSDGVTLSKLSFAGQPTTFAAPSPAGAQRFVLHGLGGQRFAIERWDRVETWSAAPLMRLSECPLSEGYALQVGAGGGAPLAIVVARDEIQTLLLDGANALGSPRPLATRSRSGPAAAGISRTGAHAAWLSDGVGYVRRLTGEVDMPLVLPVPESVKAPLRGLTWCDDERIAYWTSDSVFVLDARRLNFGSGFNSTPWPAFTEPGRISKVSWCGREVLITIHNTRERKPRVRIARVD